MMFDLFVGLALFRISYFQHSFADLAGWLALAVAVRILVSLQESHRVPYDLQNVHF